MLPLVTPRRIFTSFAGMTFLAPLSAYAADAAGPAEAAAHPSGIVDLLMRATSVGSTWILWLLLGLSVASVAIALERALFLRRENTNFYPFVSNIHTHLQSGDLELIREYCRQHDSLESRMVLFGLSTSDRSPRSAGRMMAAFLNLERHRMDRGLVFLGTLGNNAPFVGLLGTVLGIIQAFHDLSANPAGGPQVVMSGISEALITTAVGLSVAIPAVVAFNLLQRAVKRRIANAESIQELVSSHLEDLEIGGAQKRAS